MDIMLYFMKLEDKYWGLFLVALFLLYIFLFVQKKQEDGRWLVLYGFLTYLVFAGGVLILLLKPFRVGDYIIEDNKGNEGTVKEIQLFYTKLLTPDDKVIILPNGTLANTSLTNVTATDIRRLDLSVGISYTADLKKAKEIAMQELTADTACLKEKEKDVLVNNLGDSAVELIVRCYVKNEDYWPARGRLLEKVKLAYDANGIEIPFNQLDIHVDRELEK